MNRRTFKKTPRVRTLALAVLACGTAPSLAVELAAVPGQWTPPVGAPINMWGYIEVPNATAYPCPVSPVAWAVGPTLRATAGPLNVNLKNCLAEPVSFFVPGLRASTTPATAGRFTGEVAANGTGAYTFTARPGTFLYHSATDRIRTQVPMGLYGALVVDQAAGMAYSGVPYDDDPVLVFSEIDPSLNANPAGSGGARVSKADDLTADGFDVAESGWNPKFFLINGKAHPDTTRLAFTTGERILLRLVNAGLETVVPTLDGGLYATVLAEDGNRYPVSTQQYGVELPAAKTIDALLTVESPGTYPLYDRTGRLTNAAATGGGMLTYLDVAAGAGIFELSAATYNVVENGGTVSVTVNRLGGSTGAVSVDYATGVGTAIAGIDYTATSNTVTFGDGDIAAKTFTISITDDADNEGNETFSLALSNPLGGATLGTPSSATVTITDNDAAPSALQLSAATYSVAENGGPLTVTVNRVGDSAGEVSVSFVTANGTATTADNDYTAATGTLTFVAGDMSETFGVTILDDSVYEGDETFTVALNTPIGATLGTPSSATVTITENDAAPNVAPIANDDTASTPRGTSVTVNVIANDTDSDGTIVPASVVITTGPLSQRGGAVVNNGNGTVTYTPPRPSFRGTDTFTYTVNDDDGATSNVATVRVNVR